MWNGGLSALGNAFTAQLTFEYALNGSSNSTQVSIGWNIDQVSPATASYTAVLTLDGSGTPEVGVYDQAGNLKATGTNPTALLAQNTPITMFLTVNGTSAVVSVDGLNYLSTSLPGGVAYEGVGFGLRPGYGASSSVLTALNFVAAPLPVSGQHQLAIIAVAGGNVYQGTGYAPGASGQINLANGGTGVLQAGVRVAIACLDGVAYITDGQAYQTLTLATQTVAPMTADAGTLPPNCPLCCAWHGRLVFAGQIGNPQNWYMSAVGDYTNFDYSQVGVSATSAIPGNSGQSYGKIGDPIVALIPLNDDILLFGGVDQVWAMVGDPGYNGVIDHFLRDIGIFGQNAWTFDPVGTLYFVGSGGLYRLPKGGTIPENLSNRVLPDYFQSIDVSANWVVLTWDPDRQGCWIFVTPITGTGTAGIGMFWDQRTGGFFPAQFPDNHGPTAELVYLGDRPQDRALLMGGRDGFIRRMNPAAVGSDDGAAINSYAYLGPSRLIDDLFEGKVLCADFYVGQDVAGAAYGFNYQVQAAPDFYNAVYNPSATTTGGPITGQGRIAKDRQARIRGGAVCMKVANATVNQTWGLERVVLTVERGAPQR